MAALTIFSVAVFAQNKTMAKTNMQMDQMKYSCPMHPEVTSNKPGNCPKCGMALTKSKKSKMAMQETKMYTCPMHSDVTSNKPGQCSKCGMDLKQMPAAAYSCPMKCEGDKTYDKTGKCPKCGMDLEKKTEKKEDHSDHNHN